MESNPRGVHDHRHAGEPCRKPAKATFRRVRMHNPVGFGSQKVLQTNHACQIPQRPDPPPNDVQVHHSQTMLPDDLLEVRSVVRTSACHPSAFAIFNPE